MTPKISCLIYDLDGLLLDTESIYSEVTQKIVGEYNKVFDWSLKKKIIGRKSTQAAKIIVESLNLPITPEEYLDSRKEDLLESLRNSQPMSGAIELTTHFFQKGIPQAIATSSASPTFEAKYENHKKWFSQFNLIVKGDDPELKEGKPAPDIFLIAAKRLGFEPVNCLVFEDAPSGIKGALAAGMNVVAVPDPHIEDHYYNNASQVITSLKKFDPENWGLPKF
mgnify:CR=1 FL=1|tara:strand:- start:4351 stop:5019 length:669 start_codon:yes stop_codon:yes gene_type:complete